MTISNGIWNDRGAQANVTNKSCHTISSKLALFDSFRILTALQPIERPSCAYASCAQAPDIEAGTTFRMMFAETPLQAERLLKEKREPRPMGEHD